MDDRAAVEQVLAAHRASGTFFTAAGIRSFVRAEGDGDPIVLMHGLPASCFLYRKVIPELAARGFHALSFDLPGLGLADRPPDFDYTVAGLGTFAAEAVDALGIDRFHLVVHDFGGPVGFELAAQDPERVRSLTILDTVIDLAAMPFPGEVFARVAQRVGRWMTPPTLWRQLMYRVAIADRAAVPVAEVDAYLDLALGSDEGAAYLRIMRQVRSGHDPARHAQVVDSRSVPYPVRLVWGGLDPALSLRRYGWRVLESTHLPWMTVLPAKHFPQEDQAPAVAELIAQNAGQG